MNDNILTCWIQNYPFVAYFYPILECWRQEPIEMNNMKNGLFKILSDITGCQFICRKKCPEYYDRGWMSWYSLKRRWKKRRWEFTLTKKPLRGTTSSYICCFQDLLYVTLVRFCTVCSTFRLLAGNPSLTEESAKILLERGLVKVEGGTWITFWRLICCILSS